MMLKLDLEPTKLANSWVKFLLDVMIKKVVNKKWGSLSGSDSAYIPGCSRHKDKIAAHENPRFISGRMSAPD